MDYRIVGNTLVLRLVPGDEIVGCILKVAKKEKITLASVSGIGAVREITAGFLDPVKKEYQSERIVGFFEITSLVGNITTLDKEPYLHLHATWANSRAQVFGGHLVGAVVSITAEIFITQLEANFSRLFNKEIGFNLLEFPSC